MIVDLFLNEKLLAADLDLHGDGDGSIMIPNTSLLKGKNTLTIQGKGTNPANKQAHEIAFDYLEIID